MSVDLLPIDQEFDLPYEARGDSFIVLAPQLARYLGFRAASDLLRPIPEDEKGYELVRTLGGEQRVGYVTEAGFYRAMGQRQAARVTDPQARETVEQFQRWVYADFLPTVRKHGAYIEAPVLDNWLSDPDRMIEALQALKAEREAKQVLQDKVDADAPKVLLAESVMVSNDCVTIARLSNILKSNGIDVGEKRLFEWLRRDGFLCREKGKDWNRPTQRALDLGILKPRETTWFDRESNPHLSVTPYVTGKGQQYFISFYVKKTMVK